MLLRDVAQVLAVAVLGVLDDVHVARPARRDRVSLADDLGLSLRVIDRGVLRDDILLR
jgi:hypothetical protein